MATKTRPSPPSAPRVPTADDLKASLPALGQSDQGEEQDEQTDYDAIRGHLEDAHTAMTAAYAALDRLEAQQP